jgi:hypothetical protein
MPSQKRALLQRETLLALFDNSIVIDASAKAVGKLGKYRTNANTDTQDVVSSISENTAFSTIRDAYLSQVHSEQPLISLADVDPLLQQPMSESFNLF